MVFYDKKKLPPPPPDIPVTIDKKPLTKVKEKRVLGVIIDENLSFTSYIEQITKKCKTAYNRLTLHPELLPHQALQLYKAYIRTKLEYGCIIWGHTIYHKNHMKQLEDAQRGALSLILRIMKSTPLEAIESEMATTPIDLRIEELQRHEAIKLYQNQDSCCLSHKIKSYDLTNSKQSPCKHLQKILNQLLTQIAKQKHCDDINKLQLPSVNPQTFEVFTIDNLESIFPSNYRNRSKLKLSKTNTTNNEDYIDYIKTLINEKTMMIFTDGSALGNPGPTGSGVVIKKNGPESTEIKIAHAVTKMGTSYQGELQAIRIGTTYAKENISISTENLHIFVDSQAAIQAIIEQNHKNYHNITITEIRQNLINISHTIKSIKFVYCPAHKGIAENETADKLAKIAAKKVQTLEPTYIVSSSEIKTENKKMTLSKWQKR